MRDQVEGVEVTQSKIKHTFAASPTPCPRTPSSSVLSDHSTTLTPSTSFSEHRLSTRLCAGVTLTPTHT